MSYKLNNWTVSNIDYLTPQPGSAPVAGQDYVIFNIPDLTEIPYSNLTLAGTAETTVGNSLELVGNFTGSEGVYFTLYIDDATNRAGINIASGTITTLDNEHSVSVDNTDNANHKYTLTLQNGTLNVFFDTNKVITYQTTQTSIQASFGAGFFESQTGEIELNIRYLKQSKGVYHYIKPADIDFELQIDSKPTFDSVNLKTYTRSSFLTIPVTPEAWDPVSLICGSYVADSYDFKGLAMAATVHLPQRQDNKDYTFYYRVRFSGSNYTSDWSCVYLTEREKPIELTGVLDENDPYKIAYEINDINDEYLVFNPQQSDLGIRLPESPTTDGLTFTIYNASDNRLKVYSYKWRNFELEDLDESEKIHDYYNEFDIDGLSIVTISYDVGTNKWYLSVKDKKHTFLLPSNIKSLVFKGVFNYHIPAYDYVYTKAFNSGNVADFVMAVASEIDWIFNQFTIDKTNIDSFSADRDTFNERWGLIFNLDGSLFKNSAERRDAFQCMIASLPGQMIKKPISELIYNLTGAKPDIYEYKDLTFNVLTENGKIETLDGTIYTDPYYLYDENHPSYDSKPFVLYGGAPKAFTWQIDVYDPYDLQYNQHLIELVLDMFKPAHTCVIANFYNCEGVLYTKRYFYGTDNYAESLYNL